jgi:formylglycine-generating enzyme required for sulfatase activity
VFAQDQKPEVVYSIAKEVKEISWYETQLNLWKAEIDKNNRNGEAWTNYYMAARALRNVSEHASADKKKYFELCSKIIADVQKAMPNSFEGYFLAYAETGIAGSAENLKKAEAIRPYDPIILEELMIYYDVQRNGPKFEEYAREMFKANEMPAGMLNWGYNLLSELEENAVVFACGDNDTYSLWINQAAKNFRKDITVVNTYLMHLDDYRNKLLAELGYAPLDLKYPDDGDYEKNTKLICDHFFKGNRPVYVATTAINGFQEDYGDKLYLTGLAYKYSESSFDNESIIRRNYEKRYLLDYLKEVFSYNIADLKANEFNGMYLPSMVKLYKQYEESEEVNKKIELEALLIKIAEQNGQQSEILELLSSSDRPQVFLSTVLDLKSLEKNMVRVNGKVYMDKYEVTNGDYNKFLSNLQRSGQTDLYNTALYDSTYWVKKFPDGGLEPMRDMYQWHPAYAEYPVVCISQEGAKAYCEWLTKQYNLQRKRTYTQVVFRLPTEQEWRTAAGSGDVKATTPFPNNQIKNASDCYLGNIQTSKGRFFDDGGFHMVKVQTYVPNKMGLFNTFGNVSEMTSSKSVALGGSWYDLFEDCTFDKTQNCSKPDPGIGFRIVMEIIEE